MRRTNLACGLAEPQCTPCQEGVAPLTGAALQKYRRTLAPGWKVIDQHHLEKSFAFKDFRSALAFSNQVGELAEAVQHHPDLHVAWGLVRVTVWTHKVDGLTESDFLFVAKLEALRNAARRKPRRRKGNGVASK